VPKLEEFFEIRLIFPRGHIFFVGFLVRLFYSLAVFRFSGGFSYAAPVSQGKLAALGSSE
jgi:hypothetical protein